MVLEPVSVRASDRACMRSHFQRSSLKALGQSKQILYEASIGSGNQCVYK